MVNNSSLMTQEISMTGKQALIALSAAVALGIAGASAAQASDNNSGGYHGGSVMPGSMDGVNPVFHPGWFGPHARKTNGAAAFAAEPKNQRNLESR
jgi:hypothetical protein